MVLARGVLTAIAFVHGVSGHGWITQPMSRVELVTHHYQDGMPDDGLQWCPSCTNGPDACGSTGTEWTTPWSEWKPWYEAAGKSIAHFSAGEEVIFRFVITADHGGQAWMMLSCNESAAEDNIWYFMNRAASDTRGRLPSNPAIYAWPMSTNDGVVTHVVPEGFSCPNGRGIGRWLWKTGNSCNDADNYAGDTEPFKLEEVHALGGLQLGKCMGPCASNLTHSRLGCVETFLTCFDFTTEVGPAPPAPPPTPPAPPPLGPCHAISPMATDDWCQTNCHYVGSDCPPDLCECDPGMMV